MKEWIEIEPQLSWNIQDKAKNCLVYVRLGKLTTIFQAQVYPNIGACVQKNKNIFRQSSDINTGTAKKTCVD